MGKVKESWVPHTKRLVTVPKTCGLSSTSSLYCTPFESSNWKNLSVTQAVPKKSRLLTRTLLNKWCATFFWASLEGRAASSVKWLPDSGICFINVTVVLFVSHLVLFASRPKYMNQLEEIVQFFDEYHRCQTPWISVLTSVHYLESIGHISNFIGGAFLHFGNVHGNALGSVPSICSVSAFSPKYKFALQIAVDQAPGQNFGCKGCAIYFAKFPRKNVYYHLEYSKGLCYLQCKVPPRKPKETVTETSPPPERILQRPHSWARGGVQKQWHWSQCKSHSMRTPYSGNYPSQRRRLLGLTRRTGPWSWSLEKPYRLKQNNFPLSSQVTLSGSFKKRSH